MKSDFCDKIQRKCTRELCSEARLRICYQLKQKYYKSIKQTKDKQQDHQFNQFYHQYKTSLSSTSNLISSSCNLMIADENTMEFNQ